MSKLSDQNHTEISLLVIETLWEIQKYTGVQVIRERGHVIPNCQKVGKDYRMKVKIKVTLLIKY